MERLRLAGALVALLAPLGGPAVGQFQPVAMPIAAWENTEIGVGAMSGLTQGGDLLLVRWGTAPEARFFHYRDLLTPRASPYALPATPALYPPVHAAIGRFEGGAMPDVLWELPEATMATDLGVTWGAAPASVAHYDYNFIDTTHGLQPLQLLPSPHAPLLVWARGLPYSEEAFCAQDLSGARAAGVTPAPRCWAEVDTFSNAHDAEYFENRFHAVRLSPAATGRGVVDAVVPLVQGLRLLWNRTPGNATTLAEVDLLDVTVGWPSVLDEAPAGLLEPGLTVPRGSSCFGGGGIDADGDGDADLLFTMRDPSAGVPGKLLWIENTGTPSAFASAQWRSMMGRADLQPLSDPAVLRQVDLDGASALALHDRGLDQILVISGDGAGGLTVRRLPAWGATVREFFTGDVVGGAAPDLLVWVDAPGGGWELWIYPDELDLAPSLSWSPAPPAVALLGADLTLAVDASDPDSPVGVTWIRPPAADVTGTTTLTIPGEQLCSAASPVEVTVRALDDLGVYVQLAASIPVEMRPSLVLVGSDPPGRLVLPPGGASGRAEGVAWPRCGSSPSFTWGSPGLAGLVETGAGTTAGSGAWREFAVPESAYPEALSGAPALTLSAAEGGYSGTTTLPLELDARGLVGVTVSFDRPVMEAGELGTVRAVLASRLSVPLPAVRAVFRLDGLDFAGEVVVNGASATPGAADGEVVIDPLPARDATVELLVPVRSAGQAGGASVELYSAGNFRVSPEASPPGGDVVTPGCGCGTPGAAEGLPMLVATLLLSVGPRRRTR
jgi:hypothetical protein